MVTLKDRLPQWIWHHSREQASSVELCKTFYLEAPVEGAFFHIALTGALEVELDGRSVGHLAESAANVCAFHRVASFPSRLEAGEHTIRLRISCKAPMPVAPISIHLHSRLVGCIAYLSAGDLWLRTDDTWSAGEERAAIVCLLGEEPYGDLENGPEWFIAGGFGDIEAAPLNGVSIVSESEACAGIDGGLLRMKGNGCGMIDVPTPSRNGSHIFYHVRKQTEWRELNTALRHAGISAKPSVVIDLGKEYNMRFHLTNRGGAPLAIVWNGAESLYELERYEGLITEAFPLAAGQTMTTLPQGAKYIRLFALAEEGQPFELEWRADEVGVPMRQAGSLRTDSEMLNDIFDLSVHTNRVCHQLGLWDGIKRDRLNWTYDFYLAAKADYVLWDDLAVLRRSMEELGRGTPEGYWMNDIPAYTLWWLNNVWEYYLHTADREFVLSLEHEIMRHCRLVESLIDPDTQALSKVDSSLIEWVPMKPEEAGLNMQALLRITGDSLRKLKRYVPELADLPDWGYPQLASEPFLAGEQLITKLLGIQSGYIGEAEGAAFLRDYKVADPITPLSAYWLADCCSKHGLQEKAWEAVSTVWGKMLAEGATTCWESVTLQHEGDFHHALTTYTAYDSYRISLCHSWAGTPVHWVMSRVLGVEPAEPGYRKIAFRPQRLHGVAVCAGTIPTPYGAIEAGWDDSAGTDYILRVPEGIEVAGSSVTV